MKKQKGAALIVVMSLLAISLMIGLASMQSSQVDERLAGNYRATSDVQMAAEMTAAQGWKEREDHAPDSVEEMGRLRKMGWRSFTDDDLMDGDDNVFAQAAVMADCGDEIDCYYRVFDDCEDGNSCIVAMAAILDDDGRVLAESEQVFVLYSSGSRITDALDRILDFFDMSGVGRMFNILSESYFFPGSNNNDPEDVLEIIPCLISPQEECVESGRTADELGGEISSLIGELREMSDRSFVTFLSSGDATAAKLNDLTDENDGNHIVVVEGSGEFRIENGTRFDGVMIITSPEVGVRGGGGTVFNGAILHVPYSCSGDDCDSLSPTIDIRGDGFHFDPAIIERVRDSARQEGILRWE